MKARIASAFGPSSADWPMIRPLPGSCASPAAPAPRSGFPRDHPDRLVVDEASRQRRRPPARALRAARNRGTARSRCRSARARRRRAAPAELDPRCPVLARDPNLLPLQVCRARDPRRCLGEDDAREVGVDREDVADRDALAHRGDHARPVGDPDVHGALADQRHQLRVDLVLERDLEAGVPIVARLVGEIELRELDVRYVPETDRQLHGLGRGGGRRG